MGKPMTSPIRILHALGSLNRGGIETWLMHVLRHIDRDRFHMDFLVHTDTPAAYDEEVRALGSRIIPCRPTGLRRPWSYATYSRRLTSILNEYGPYDVVHGHMQELSGYFLRAGERSGVNVRIAHSHNGVPPAQRQPGILRRVYGKWMGRQIDRYATHGLACSDVAARSMYGESWQSDSRWRILHYGIDPTPFAQRVVAKRMRSELGIPDGARVAGHVGRFVEQKNHAFLVEVIAASVELAPNICFLLVGEGPLRPQIEQVIRDRNLARNVVFTGARSDVPHLMLSAMDIFVFPSLWEGLGIVVLEAQAAGLPALVSEYVPQECAVIPGQVEHLQLGDGPKSWAQSIVRLLDREPLDQAVALASVSSSGFTVERSTRALQDVYIGSLSP